MNRLARPCSADEDIIQKFIEEAELNDIRPRIGSSLFQEIINNNTEKYELLLNGGEYQDKCGPIRYFVGLRKALAYYTYARIVKNGSDIVTRYGFVDKTDQYSSNSEFKIRHQAYSDAFSIADSYMKECLNYMLSDPDLFQDLPCRPKMINNRVIIKQIGE